MKLAKRQLGQGLFGWMLMLVLVGFVALFAIKLTPVYMENFSVRSMLESFKTDGAPYASVDAVRRAIDSRLQVNDVKSITAEDVLVEPAGPGSYTLRVDYEVRVPFISNVSLAVKFSEEGNVRGGSE